MVERFYGMEQTRVRFPVAPQGPQACGPQDLEVQVQLLRAAERTLWCNGSTLGQRDVA